MTFRTIASPAALAAGMAQPAQTARRFEPRGPLALDPMAFGIELAIGKPPERKVEQRGPVAVVEITGPLMHHADPWCDSYDEIKARVGEALASPAACVLLSIDSPGGLVAGCFDTVSELRAMSAAAGKPLYCYVDAQATSAAYAIATAAERIWIPTTGAVGSIGIIEPMVDVTAMDAAMGIRFTMLTSGARKADGHPHVETTDEAIAAAQSRVDQLAAVFFATVAERRGLEPSAVQRLDAALVCGQAAVDAGLADAIGTFDTVLVELTAQDAAVPDTDSAPTGAQTAQAQAEATHPLVASEPHKEIPMKMSEIRSGLKAVADDENAPEDDRAAARKALTAMDEKEPEAAEEDDSPPPPPAEEDKAEDEEEEPEAATPAAPAASASAAVDGLALAARVQELEAREARRAAKAERSALMASRPDFSPDVVAFLDRQPLAIVRDACAAPEKGGLPRGNGKGGQVGAARAAITGAGAPTAGFAAALGQRDGIIRTDVSGHGAELDERMGLVAAAPITGRNPDRPNCIRLGVMTPEEARAFRAHRAAAAASTPKGVK